MAIKDWTKLVVCVLVLTVTGIMLYFGKIQGEAGVSIISAVLGYVFGNGHGVLENNLQGTRGGSTIGQAELDDNGGLE